jgi:uroporphyrin-III C-methyltransferase
MLTSSLVSMCHAGRDVIRLKIGDPFLFGRGGEEVIEYRQYGVEPKVRHDSRILKLTQ